MNTDMWMTNTRFDTRYVRQGDPRAVLEAWAGDLQMGAWSDSNEADFRAAAADDFRTGIGRDLRDDELTIKVVEREDA